MTPTPRILVFIVAYDAERHIASVIERIPQELLNRDDLQVLCIDDASSDRSAVTAQEYVTSHGIRNVTVLRNPVNQGYGGNQKLGYRLAIDAGFDLVILLHGDGQYAPELLPLFIDTWRKTGADVLLGSRMLSLASARRGGMPLYKLVGNRVLTTLQNAITGKRLSEYHTGYRAFSTRFLRGIPFEINTNDFHFDTEILLQAFHTGAKIVEFAVPAHYGDEVCHVNGMKYAGDVLASTLAYKFHTLGMLSSVRYEAARPSDYYDRPEQRYTAAAHAFRMLKRSRPARVLDLKCGSGYFARRCREIDAKVVGLDLGDTPPPEAIERYHRCDLERDPLPEDPFSFDAIVGLDVLERLARPEELLLRIRKQARQTRPAGEEPPVIFSTPNIAFVTVRLNLLLGRFPYAERGILNIAHKRLFTRSALKNMLEDCGYVVEESRPVGPPFEIVMGGRMGRVLGWLSDRLARLWPSMFGFQFVVRARPRPHVSQLLSRSERFVLADSRLEASLEQH